MSAVEAIIEEYWDRGDLSFKLWEQQEPIYNTIKDLPYDASIVVLLCARQFGKSYLGAILYVEDCLNFDNVTVLVVGPTQKQAMSIVWPRLKAVTGDLPPHIHSNPVKSENRWEIGKSEIVVGGFDTQSSAHRGKTLLKIYIEEVVDSDPDTYIESMRSDLGPALLHSIQARMVFLTTPPKIPDHPFITETIPEARLGNAYFEYTIYDNKQLSEEQFNAAVKFAGGKDTVDWLREYLVQIVRDPDVLILPSFDETLAVNHHIRLPKQYYMHFTMDFGGTRDLTAAYLHYYDYLRNKSVYWDERWFKANTATKKIVKECNEMMEPYIIKQKTVDGPGQLLIDLKNDYDWSVTLPPKVDWKANLNALNVRYSENQIEVHPRCELLIETARSGTLNKQKNDFARTKALGHMDAAAAQMYGNRVEDRRNPYEQYEQLHGVQSNTIFVKPKVDPKSKLARDIAGKGLGSFKQGQAPKRFGRH